MLCPLNKKLIITVMELQMSSKLTLYPGHPYLIPKPKQLINHAYNIRSRKSLRVTTLRQDHLHVEIELNSRKYLYEEKIISEKVQRF